MTVEQPALFTGWEADAPVGDTMMRRFVMNCVESSARAVTAHGGRTALTPRWALADMGQPAGFLNTVMLLQPPTAGVGGELVAELAGGRGAVWMFSPWPTPDFAGAGWVLEGHPPLMLRPAGGQAPPDPPGLQVGPVRDETDARVWQETAVAGYPMPDIDLPLLRPPGPGAQPRAWLARWQGRPVGASAAYVAAGVVQVSLVAVLAEARRRGVGAALTWRATLVRPDLPALLLASDGGRPVYEAMGYLPLLRFSCWRLDRP